MKIHILGICGTFMGSLARIARSMGHQVSGADQQVYPPMSDQLGDAGIPLIEGYHAGDLPADCDLVIIGNALSRGNAAVEAVLDRGLSYTSGAQWLAEHALTGKQVLAVAGTHGKTTTSSMLAWILEETGHNPGFLIGGVPANFGISARWSDSPFFVIEADEYDTAFFDKRSKFVHYRPRIQVLNNLEFDHADIFDSIDQIKTQFHHLVRTIPGQGTLIVNRSDAQLAEVLSMGCWSRQLGFGTTDSEWQARFANSEGSALIIRCPDGTEQHVSWSLQGDHNLSNALAAVAAAAAADIDPGEAVQALGTFRGVKRRMELIAEQEGLSVFEDFAHHPTAIRTTISGCRKRAAGHKIIVALEPRSHSMRSGTHADALAPALDEADDIHVLVRPELEWNAHDQLAALGSRLHCHDSIEALQQALLSSAQSRPAMIILMSNGSFDGLPQRLPALLETHCP